MNRPEQTLQRACVQWFRMQYPKGIIHHSPNGGKRSKVEASIFKGLGVLAGFPDLICIYRGRIVFVELKADNGTLSHNQEDVIERIVDNEFPVYVCFSLDLFIRIIKAEFD